MTTPIVKVYAATVDREKVVLFHDTQRTTMIQGDPRIPQIINILKSRHFDIHNPVLIDLSDNFSRNEVLQEFADKNTFMRLFRVAKSLIKEMLTGAPQAQTETQAQSDLLEEATFGSIDATQAPVPQSKKAAKAIEQIQAAAQPLSVVKEDTTVVAVIGESIVPGVENLTEQMRHSLKECSQGAARFFQRLGDTAAVRRHSAEDLMKFLQKGDLPLAEDGSIIAYKILKSTNQPEEFADPHTGRVLQRVGDRVCMDTKLVDPNRTNECSNGLHVARVDYLPQFKGTHIFLIRIRPEDVIAVPYADGSKMRVRAYEILVELPQEIRSLLLSGKSIMTHPQGAEILSKALSLNFAPPVRQVEITEHNGQGIVVTDLNQEEQKTGCEAVPVPAVLAPSKESSVKQQAAPVLPKDLAQERKEEKQKQQDAGNKPVPRQEKAAMLLRNFQRERSKEGKFSAATELKKFKRESKVGWDRLGLTATEVAVVEDFLQKHG